MYIEDFRRSLARIGCQDYRASQASSLSISNEEIRNKLAGIDFYSMTIRAFKLDLEDRCEDYGQVAKYKGGLAQASASFILDDHHEFALNRPVLVCSNTAKMLSETRFSKYFDVIGDESNHLGLFDCSKPPSVAHSVAGSCC